MSFLNIKITLCASLIAFSSLSCSGRSNKAETVVEEKENLQTNFQMVAIPDSLKEPKDRANYLVQHYWDNYDFSDTTYIHKPGVLEQAMVDYIQVLPVADKSVSDSSITQTIRSAEIEGKILNQFLELFKKYLYDPTSPQKNEEFYITVLENTLKSDSVDEVEKARAKFALEMLLKNRQGELANNIIYTLASGKQSSLYDLKKEYTLLMFYNPDCHACEIITGYMKQSPFLQKALDAKLVDVLAVYPDDNRERWEQYAPNLPETWINGYDKNQNVQNKRLYELRAMPTIYLLDKDKKVILKDVNVEDVERYLVNNNPFVFSNM